MVFWSTTSGKGSLALIDTILSASKRLYYQLKPFLPRSAVRLVRKGYRQFQEDGFPLGWPIEDRFVKFLNTVYKTNSKLAINNNQLSMVTSDVGSDPLVY